MPNSSDPFAEFDQAAQDYGYHEPAAPPAPQPEAPVAPPMAPPAAAPIDPDLAQLLDVVSGQPAQPQQPQTPPQAPQAVPYDRFQQIAEENKYLRDLVARSVNGQPSQPHVAPQQTDPGTPPAGLDPEVWEIVQPFLAQQRQEILNEIAPVIDSYQREQATDMLTQTVPGFTREMMPELEREFMSLPPQDRPGYAGRGGAEALAYRIVLRNAQAQRSPVTPNIPARGSSMAHSVNRSGGMVPQTPRPINVNSLTAQEFEQLKRASEMRRFGAGFDSDEPDPILDGRF